MSPAESVTAPKGGLNVWGAPGDEGYGQPGSGMRSRLSVPQSPRRESCGSKTCVAVCPDAGAAPKASTASKQLGISAASLQQSLLTATPPTRPCAPLPPSLPLPTLTPSSLTPAPQHPSFVPVRSLTTPVSS